MNISGSKSESWSLNCPVSISTESERITLALGEGGRLSRQFIQKRIIQILGNDSLNALDDAARLPEINGPLAMTTDSFVVSPLFFPGGDIGSLSVYGTINDLAVSGAVPLYLSLSFMLEEGLPIAIFDCLLESIASAVRQTGVLVVTGDTKVVPAGAVDGMFINTTGIGKLQMPIPPGPSQMQPGDELIVSGPIGRHGIAVLTARENLALTPAPESDSAPLLEPINKLRLNLGNNIRCMRDATRGGVAAVLHEWSQVNNLTMTINEKNLPVSADVRGASELLGLDPLHIANEGTMVIAVEQGHAERALETLRSFTQTKDAAQIGQVTDRGVSAVTVRRTLGLEQPLDDPTGAPLPRIC